MTQSASSSSSPAIGIAFVLGATLFFSLNDLSIKMLSGAYPLHQIVFIRAAVSLLLTLFVFMPFDGGWGNLRTRRPFLHAFRGFLVVVSNTSYFAAIAQIPLADASAIFYVAPLFITGLSMLVLGETVGLRRWVAVIVGLIGVIIVIRPGAATFSMVSLLPMLAAACYAGMQIMTRSAKLTERATTLTFYIQVTFLVFYGILGLWLGDGRYSGHANQTMELFLRPWTMPSTVDLAIMMGLGFVSASAGYLIAQAYRASEAGLLAPFEYTTLLLAVFWGIAIWGEWPSASTWLGIVLIAGSGVFVALREAQLGRRPSANLVAGRR